MLLVYGAWEPYICVFSSRLATNIKADIEQHTLPAIELPLVSVTLYHKRTSSNYATTE